MSSPWPPQCKKGTSIFSKQSPWHSYHQTNSPPKICKNCVHSWIQLEIMSTFMVPLWDHEIMMLWIPWEIMSTMSVLNKNSFNGGQHRNPLNFYIPQQFQAFGFQQLGKSTLFKMLLWGRGEISVCTFEQSS
jgi:hypothetical protein